MSNVYRFEAFLDHLKTQYCRPGCDYNATRCPIVQALLVGGYEDREWCPWCDGYKIYVREDKIKSRKESEESHETSVYRGGHICGWHPRSTLIRKYRALFACFRCNAGKGLQGIKFYEPDPDREDDCFQKRCRDFQESGRELIKHKDKEASSCRA